MFRCVALLFLALLWVGCERDNPTESPGACTGSSLGTIGSGDGHTHGGIVQVCQEHQGSGAQFELGEVRHTHTVNYSAAEIGQILNGEFIGKYSSTNQEHRHWISFNWVPPQTEN